jgi:hypothetical protein
MIFLVLSEELKYLNKETEFEKNSSTLMAVFRDDSKQLTTMLCDK